jgi:glycosyltransferase involved in cell wall biosynthesis
MRILYCNKYNFAFSGTEAYLFASMEMMRARGHETALFSMADLRGDSTPYDRHFVSHLDFKAPHGIAAKTQLALHAIYSTEARQKLRAMIREFRPDVAHVRNIYHHLSPSILWELEAQGVPVLYHMNDFKMLCPSYNMVSATGESCEGCKGGRFSHVVLGRCYTGGIATSAVLAAEAYIHRWLGTYERCVDIVLAPSRFVKDKLIENGWDAERIQVLPHFQNVPEGTVPHPGKTGAILYFGRLSREKGIPDLLAAIGRFPHLQLVIAGDGPVRSELEGFAAGSGLTNVSFVGHVSGSSLDELISRSQFTVFPSHAYETFGKSILESFALGRAVIASDLGSRRELVQEGETGLLYRVGSVDQLAAAIAFLSERPELSQQMGESARQLVIERHSQNQHFLALSSIYENLSAKKKLRSAVPATKPGLRVAFIGGRGIVGKYSGIESFYEEVGQRLAARGHLVTAYCRNYFTPAIHSYKGIKIVRLPTICSKHLDTSVHSFLSTVHACFSDYDIVHFHTLGPSLFAYFPRLFRKKTVVSVQGLDWQRKKWSWLARQVLKAGEWSSARLPNKTIVVSHALEAYYRSRYEKPVAYLPNGTELRGRQRGNELARLGLTPDQYVLFLGRFSPEKNCDMLIEAFEQIDTSMKLVLAGGSSHTDDYVASLRSHERDKVRFVGWLSGDALAEVLTNAALFVLPSDMEGLSLALLDAMGAGVCVLASDTPENREVIGDAGFTFRRTDGKHLRQMMTMLIPAADLRSAAGKRAQQRVQQEYLWDDVTRQLERMYLELIANESTTISQPCASASGRAA